MFSTIARLLLAASDQLPAIIAALPRSGASEALLHRSSRTRLGGRHTYALTGALLLAVATGCNDAPTVSKSPTAPGAARRTETAPPEGGALSAAEAWAFLLERDASLSQVTTVPNDDPPVDEGQFMSAMGTTTETGPREWMASAGIAQDWRNPDRVDLAGLTATIKGSHGLTSMSGDGGWVDRVDPLDPSYRDGGFLQISCGPKPDSCADGDYFTRPCMEGIIEAFATVHHRVRWYGTAPEDYDDRWSNPSYRHDCRTSYGGGGDGGGEYEGGDQEGGGGGGTECESFYRTGIPCDDREGADDGGWGGGGGPGEEEDNGEGGGNDDGGEIGPPDPCQQWPSDPLCAEPWYGQRMERAGSYMQLAGWDGGVSMSAPTIAARPYIIAVTAKPLPRGMRSMIGRFHSAEGSRDVIYLSSDARALDWSIAVQTLLQDRRHAPRLTQKRVLRVYADDKRTLSQGRRWYSLPAATMARSRATRNRMGLTRAFQAMTTELGRAQDRSLPALGRIRLTRWPAPAAGVLRPAVNTTPHHWISLRA